MKIKAVIFDLDGTLRDTRDLIYAAVKHAIHVHTGSTPTDTELAEYMHHHSHVHQQFASHVSLEEFEASFHGKLYELLPNVALYEHAVATISGLHAAGYKLAIVSSAKPAEIQHFLKRASIDSYFAAIAGDDGVHARKPSAEPVLYALQQLNVLPEESIMVGDMRVDMQAARAAGVPVMIGISHGFESTEQLRAAGADRVVDALSELPTLLEGLTNE